MIPLSLSSTASTPIYFEAHSGLKICISSPTTSMIKFFDGSQVNPIKEASLVLDDQITFLDHEAISQDNLEVVSWLVSIKEESMNTSCICFSETCGTHSPKFSIFHSDRGSHLSFSKDSNWVFDKKSELSSCISWITDSSDENSSSLSFSSTENASEIMDLEECSIDKPLFWPFDSTFEWGSGSFTEWDFFIMSPRKNICIVKNNSPNTLPDSPRLRLFKGKLDLEKVKRRLVFHSRSNSSVNLEFKSVNSTRGVRRMKSMPSRFKKGLKTNEDGCNKQSSEDKDFVKNNVFLENHLPVEMLNVEPAIETLIGLDEFDGHEGIECEFNKDDFFLDVHI